MAHDDLPPMDPTATRQTNANWALTQIEQGDTGHSAIHVEQLMAMARRHGSAGVSGSHPERDPQSVRPTAPLPVCAARAPALGAAAALPPLPVAAWGRR